jgi:hypothetical protein
LPTRHGHAHRQRHANAERHTNRNTAACRTAAGYCNALCCARDHGHANHIGDADTHAYGDTCNLNDNTHAFTSHRLRSGEQLGANPRTHADSNPNRSAAQPDIATAANRNTSHHAFAAGYQHCAC